MALDLDTRTRIEIKRLELTESLPQVRTLLVEYLTLKTSMQEVVDQLKENGDFAFSNSNFEVWWQNMRLLLDDLSVRLIGVDV